MIILKEKRSNRELIVAEIFTVILIITGIYDYFARDGENYLE